MDREEIIRMAREACSQAPREDWNSTAWVFGSDGLETFAALVAAAEREALKRIEHPDQSDVIEVLRTAIEEAEKQEPVAWRWKWGNSGWQLEDKRPHNADSTDATVEPLYTHPAPTVPVQEPVAWVNHGENRITRVTGWDGYGALYTTPPAAQRQPLTDEQIRDLWSWSATTEAERTANTQQHAFARAIEAAHDIKEKNT